MNVINHKWIKWAGLTWLVTSIMTVEQLALAKPNGEIESPDPGKTVGERGDWALGLEDMVGGSYNRQTDRASNGEETGNTHYGAYGPSLGRLAADYFVSDRLSLGGSFDAWGNSSDEQSWSYGFDTFGVRTRLGYLVTLGGPQLWLRAGVGYAYYGNSASNPSFGHSSDDHHTLSVSADPALLLPVYHQTFLTISPGFSHEVSFRSQRGEGAYDSRGWGQTVRLGGGVMIFL
ncbi:MAG: hypothetical protein RJA70_4314 [Pseudomonadota bacterium]|jgi:hypothetical protein